MSRSSHLPPRYPCRKKVPVHRTHDSSPFSPPKVNEPGTRHHKSYSKTSSLADQPDWLDDLLSDSDWSSSPKERYHCPTASDSSTPSDGLVLNMVFWPSDDDRRLCSKDSSNPLESECMYGPNSPRQKCNVEFSGTSALLALSECVNDSSPMQFIDEVYQKSRTSDLDPQGDCLKQRHPGQRARARKLQYIAELEQTVNSIQALESELVIKRSTLLQQRVALSMENSKLKQHMARLQQQKLMKDGEYQTLRKEVERLKFGLSSSLSRKLHRYAGSCDFDDSGMYVQTSDWNKLHL